MTAAPFYAISGAGPRTASGEASGPAAASALPPLRLRLLLPAGNAVLMGEIGFELAHLLTQALDLGL